MEMSEKDIVHSYMMAKNRGDQIKILAELNCCPKEKIMEILRNNGVEVNGRVFNGGNHKKPKENNELPVDEDLKKCHEIIQTKQEVQAEEIKMFPKTLHVPQLIKHLAEDEICRLQEEMIDKEMQIKDLMRFLKEVEDYEKENRDEIE